MEQHEFYQQLVRRYGENALSEEEYELFFHALGMGLLAPYLEAVMNEAGAIGAVDARVEALALETAEVPLAGDAEPIPGAGELRRGHSGPMGASEAEERPVRRQPRWMRPAAAAAIIALLAGGAWLWLGRPAAGPGSGMSAVQRPILPAGNKAILTLANGKKIVLDSAANGLLAAQGATQIQKTNGGLSYIPPPRKEQAAAEVQYNVLATPRGGFYQLLLPDGTHVWLNAASAITYPAAFTGADRTVTLRGEAYFDVAADPARPFRIQIAGISPGSSPAEIDVLGTGFNIAAYADEPEIRTTLIRGAIRVRRDHDAVILRPGQQARMSVGVTTENNSIRLVPDADTAAAIAWMSGFFQFRELSVAAVMRQVSRWYNVDIVYDAPASAFVNRHFGGRISRRKSLSDLLPILEANQIRFRLDGATIHVLP